MKKIGMLVAVEMDAVLRRYGTAERREKRSGFEIHVYDMGAYELYAIRSGAGRSRRRRRPKCSSTASRWSWW